MNKCYQILIALIINNSVNSQMNIEYNILDMSNIEQQGNLCWAYSALMFERYNQQKTTLCDILKNNDETCCENGEIDMSCSNEGFRIPFIELQYSYNQSYNRIPEWQLIKDQINASLPLVLQIWPFSSNTSHYIIIKGYADFKNSEGRFVLINNSNEPDNISHWKEFSSLLLNKNTYLNSLFFDIKKNNSSYALTKPSTIKISNVLNEFFEGSETIENLLISISEVLNQLQGTEITNTINLNYLLNALQPSEKYFSIENNLLLSVSNTSDPNLNLIVPLIDNQKRVLGAIWVVYDGNKYYFVKTGRSRFESDLQKHLNGEIEVINFMHSTSLQFDAVIYTENEATMVRLNKTIKGINTNEQGVLDYKTFSENYQTLINK